MRQPRGTIATLINQSNIKIFELAMIAHPSVFVANRFNDEGNFLKLTTLEHTSRTILISEDDKDDVRLTLDDANPNIAFINITSHRSSFSATVNLGTESITDWLLSKEIDSIVDTLVPFHQRYEFDPVTCANNIRKKIKSSFDNKGESQEAFEHFWDTTSYSLDNASTREEAVEWIVSNMKEECDHYDALELASVTRFTQEVRLISEDAIPMIKRAIKAGMITDT